MIIDWQKFVVKLVPSIIRKPILLSLLDTFVKQVGDNYNVLKANNEKALLYASCTPQVIWLQYLLRQELNDNSISIVEGNGLPVDFVVYTELENTDRLKALLNRFKLAGKSYVMISESIDVNIRWSDAVCERLVPNSVIHWIDAVCEKVLAQLRILDASGNYEIDTLNYSANPATETIYVDYPGDSVSVVKINGGSGCTITFVQDHSTIPHRKQYTVSVTLNPADHPARSWQFSFSSDGQTKYLLINQDEY